MKKKLRICFLGSFTAGGTESACFELANILSEEYKVFILNTGSKNATFYLKDHIQFRNLQSSSIWKKNIEVYHYLKDNRIDVLVTLEALTGIISVFPAKFARCKHIIWEHANYYQSQGSRWMQKIRQVELCSADAYVVLTERDKNNFIKHFRIKAKLEQIYNIVKLQDNHMYNLDSKLIISVGHIRKIKNFIVIPDIGKIVFDKHPDWCWKVYGTNSGEEYEKIRKKIIDFGLGKNIVFCGRYDDMDLVYREAAMYVMTSLQEGLPMVLLEAKSNKLPLVSFDIETGPDEIIRNGVNGFLIQPYDTEEMAEKIITLIENEELRKNFSDKSYLDQEKFSNDRIVEQWNKLICDIIK